MKSFFCFVAQTVSIFVSSCTCMCLCVCGNVLLKLMNASSFIRHALTHALQPSSIGLFWWDTSSFKGLPFFRPDPGQSMFQKTPLQMLSRRSEASLYLPQAGCIRIRIRILLLTRLTSELRHRHHWLHFLSALALCKLNWSHQKREGISLSHSHAVQLLRL